MIGNSQLFQTDSDRLAGIEKMGLVTEKEESCLQVTFTRDALADQLSLSDAAYLLDLPRSFFGSNREGLPLAQEPFYYLEDILRLKEQYVPRTSRRWLVEVSQDEIKESLNYFRKWRYQLTTIRSVTIYFHQLDALCDGHYVIRQKPPYGLYLPQMVIRDVEGQEIWLKGCNCGYGGEGPRASMAILRACGFDNEEILRQCLYTKLLKVVRLQESIDVLYATPVSWDREVNHIAVVNGKIRYEGSLEGFSRYLKHPQKAIWDARTGRLIIEDFFGREFACFPSQILKMKEIRWERRLIRVGIRQLIQALEFFGFEITPEKQSELREVIESEYNIKRDPWYVE